MIIDTIKCDMCGKIKVIAPGDNWTTTHCPQCQRLKGEKPHNLTPEEIRKKIVNFSHYYARRVI